MSLFSAFSRAPSPTADTEPVFFFNTLTGTKDRFVPLQSGSVTMYNCGPTVYDYQHIGNLRPYVLADVLRRVLERQYQVTQVINITDVGHLTSDADVGEDKMEEGSRKAGLSAQELAESVTAQWKEDLQRLCIDTGAIHFAKATEYIPEQIALAKALDEKGYTYATDDGLYFDTTLFKDYGKLGSINLEHLRSGARVDMGGKKHPTDFALWKRSPGGSKRQQEWDSPWGVGFPGWHLECTAMIFAELGKQIDIHTGGIDHIPVHHNNEIAQAESVTGKQYARYWLHGAFITIEGQKISKSLGNTIRLDQIVDRGFFPLAFRYWLLTGHYRSPMNFTWEALQGAHTAYQRLLKLFVEDLGSESGTSHREYTSRFKERMHDDLDTPQAVAIMWELLKDASVSPPDKRATLLNFDKMLGLGLAKGDERIQAMLAGTAKRVAATEASEKVQQLLEAREAARNAKDFQKADELRRAIEQEGYRVIDSKEGPQLEKK